jgi:predicted dehydrogenase
LAEAERIVEICEEAGITLMINQQARWAPYHTAMKVLIDRGCLGHLYSVLHVHRQCQDSIDSTWLTTPDLTIIDNGIHYVDLSRYFTGRTPRWVKTTTTRVPGQHAMDPMIYTILCEYEPADLMSTLHFNNIAPALHHSPYLWHIDGTDASASIARHGPLRDGRTELTISFKEDPDQRQVFHIHGSWFPDAWGGTMGEMQRALAAGVEPQVSGRDNLNSIRITNAAVESSKTGQTVEIPPE